MKKRLFPFLMLSLCLVAGCSDDDDDEMIKPAPGDKNIVITDPAFKAALVKSFDKDGNKEISLKEADAIRSIQISTDNIYSVKGIENMTNLTQLKLVGNTGGKAKGRLNALDISKNQMLKELNCAGNQLTALDLSKNPALETVDCSSNKITNLSGSGNRGIANETAAVKTRAPEKKTFALKNLYCQNNCITSLDLSEFTALTELQCGNNQLTKLDISGNKKLKKIKAENNPQLKTVVVWKDFDKKKTEVTLPEKTVIQPEGQDPAIPVEPIAAVGFDTEKPVKKISTYIMPQPDQEGAQPFKICEMEFEWQGNNIVKLTINQFQGPNPDAPQGEGEKIVSSMEYDYSYEKNQIVCNTLFDGKQDDAPVNIALDAEGYATGYTYNRTETQAYSEMDSDSNYIPKSITWEVKSTCSAVRDAAHRVTRLSMKTVNTYKPADLQWLKDHKEWIHQDREETMEYKYDAKGNVVEPPFSSYTDYENKNGFFIGTMHAYHNPRSIIPMGPYDLFNVVKTGNLPHNFQHEIYTYEFDKEGYVTKVNNCREDYSDENNPGKLSVFTSHVIEYQ